VLTIDGGATSRASEMATGMNPIATPCSTRPVRTSTRLLDSAVTSEPTSRIAAEVTRTGFLPTRSASRPVTGMATAAPSSVAVTTQEAFDADVPSSWGSSDWMGMTSDCISAAHRLPNARTAMISPARGTGGRSTLAAPWMSFIRASPCVSYILSSLCMLLTHSLMSTPEVIP
jgi:hypothetical protein